MNIQCQNVNRCINIRACPFDILTVGMELIRVSDAGAGPVFSSV